MGIPFPREIIHLNKKEEVCLFLQKNHWPMNVSTVAWEDVPLCSGDGSGRKPETIQQQQQLCMSACTCVRRSESAFCACARAGRNWRSWPGRSSSVNATFTGHHTAQKTAVAVAGVAKNRADGHEISWSIFTEYHTAQIFSWNLKMYKSVWNWKLNRVTR